MTQIAISLEQETLKLLLGDIVDTKMGGVLAEIKRVMQASQEVEEMLTVQQVASRLQVSDATVRRYIYANKLKAVRTGQEYRISSLVLSAYEKAYQDRVQRRKLV
jgi:excisionase family DNA binding protein